MPYVGAGTVRGRIRCRPVFRTIIPIPRVARETYCRYSLCRGRTDRQVLIQGEVIPILLEGQRANTVVAVKHQFDLALAEAYAIRDEFDQLLLVAQRMLQVLPKSQNPTHYYITAPEGLKRLPQGERILRDRLKADPNDAFAL